MAQEWTNRGPRERVTPKSQRVGEVVAQDTSSAGRGRPRDVEVYGRPGTEQRDAREARKAQETATREVATDLTTRETAEVAPDEVAADTAKPTARKSAARKSTATSDERETGAKE